MRYRTCALGAICLILAAHAPADTLDMEGAAPMGDMRRALAPLVGAMESDGFGIGISIEDASGARFYDHRADKPFVLASNTKLFTTAAAALALPPGFRWRTEARLADGVLWIIGRGDATFHIMNGHSHPDQFLDLVADALAARSVESVPELVIDARYFDSAYQHPDWPADQLRRRYAAPVSGMPYARGLVRIKRGRSSVYAATSDPVATATAFLVKGLQKRGIAVERARPAAAREKQPPEYSAVYRQECPWLLDRLLRETNAESDNYLAEHLFKTLGAEFHGRGSFEGSAEAVHAALSAAGVVLTGFTQVDGSGLARNVDGGNRASAETVTSLLRVMAGHPLGGPFLGSLAVSGQRGTLRHRLDGGPLAGRIHAKTGWIKGSLTLSGYMHRDDSRVAVFSILVNYDAPYTYDRRQVVIRFQEQVLRVVWDRLETVNTDWGIPPSLARTFGGSQAAN
jgi:serine-type D-Ala-D-Ala carboxypeptidase/endopeptidase (penicillin-binding protein 4)